MTSTKIEFLVKMTCESCVDSIRKSLENVGGIQNLDINLENGSVVIESTVSILELQNKLESTGRLVAIKGYDGSISGVSIIEAGNKNVQGIVRFVQATSDTCILDGVIDGLLPGEHNIEIHECGDLSRGCQSVGKVYQPANHNGDRIYGSLGKIKAGNNGRAKFRLEDNLLKLSEVIGRSFTVNSKVNGLTYEPVACGIIARSAGLFQNPKQICACDGTTIWDEVSKPNRQSNL